VTQDGGQQRVPGSAHGRATPTTADIVEHGGGRRFPSLNWRPSRGAAILAAAGLLVGLAVGYAAGAHQAGSGARPPRHAGTSAAADTSGSSATAVAVLTQSYPECAVQVGRELQLGVQVGNQSAAEVTLRHVRPVLPLGGLRAVGQEWAPCGALSSGQYLASNRLSPGASIWVTFTFTVLVRCPGPLPVEFAVDYDWQGQHVATTLPGFSDLGKVPYSGCRVRY
jgi:hypothetical protein